MPHFFRRKQRKSIDLNKYIIYVDESRKQDTFCLKMYALELRQFLRLEHAHTHTDVVQTTNITII